jgi:HK97 family phage major capsid protein
MKNLQELRDRRSARAQELKALLDANPGDKWTAAHNEKYDQGIDEIANIDSEIKRHVDLKNAMEVEFENEFVIDKAERIARDKRSPSARYLAAWLKGGDDALTAEQFLEIRNTMSTTTSGEGGYTVQSDVLSTLIDSLKEFGGMREEATLIRTAQGNPMAYPTSDGTSEVGELIAENITATGADPTFGTVSVNPYKFSSKIVAVPFELLQDSEIDIEAFVGNRLSQRIGRIENQFFTTGTGTGQPRGVVTGAGSGKVGTSGQTLTVISDDLIDLLHSVDPAYRKGGSPCFMMHDLSLAKIRKLKDSQNRPIYIPGYDGLAGAMKDTLLGYKVCINQDVAQMAANAKSILFGDMSKYIIRDVMNAQLFRFTDSAYTKLGQVGFLMWQRAGGNLIDAGAVKYYQNSAT